MRYSKEVLSNLHDVLRTQFPEKTLKVIAKELNINYDTVLYHNMNVNGKTNFKFTDEEKSVMIDNPDKLTVKQIAAKFNKPEQSIYNFLSANKIKAPNEKTVDMEERKKKIAAMTGKFNTDAIALELGIAKSTVISLANKMGVSLRYDRTVLLPYAERIRQLGETMCKKEIYETLVPEIPFNFSYSTLTIFMLNQEISSVPKKGFQRKQPIEREKRKFEPYREKVMQLIGTMTWGEIADACGVSISWMKNAARDNGISNPYINKAPRNSSGFSAKSGERVENVSVSKATKKRKKEPVPVRETVYRTTQKAVYRKPEPQPLVIKETAESMAQKGSVKVNSKTWVFPKTNKDIDSLREKYCGARY